MRRSDEDGRESGFTLIELLIVIVVLGILAAIVVFSLSGVTGQSKSAACTSDAKTVEIAVDAYNAEAGNFPADSTALLGTAQTGGPFLHQWPSTSNYTITIDTAGGVFVDGSTFDSSGGGTNPCSTVS